MSEPTIPDRLVVDGVERPLAAGPDRSLLLALREDLGLTGAKPGCGEGACGSCTVLLDGQPVRACQVHLSEIRGRAVRTIEGSARDGRPHPVQQAFLEVGAFQCGYCTAGMIMSTIALLEADPAPDEATVREALDGNVCRCGTYPRILRAVDRAAELLAATGHDGPVVPTVEPGPDPRSTDAWHPRRPWDLTPIELRDWFDVLPDGLIAVHERDADEPGWSTSHGAWVHLGADGTATAFTGKVDVGQDDRTALSMVVAEELRLPLASVRLVMGDTDLCPYDLGTFGSRSTPDAAPLLRRAAGGVRDGLLDLAARRLATDPNDLVAADGRVRASAGGDGIAYGELVRGLQVVEQVPGAPAAAEPGGAVARMPAVAPTRAPRMTGARIVTGTKAFPSDLSLPGMLHGRVLRPPVEGASLREADTSAAAAIPRVTIVRDGSFIGAVAASPFLAGRAVGAIVATWDRPDAPSAAELGSWLRAHPAAASDEHGWGGAFHRETGDVDAALATAPTRLEATYTTAYLAHVPLETHTALARWDAGRMTVWTGTQVPFGVRAEVAEALRLPEEDVRIIVPDTGGGFGGKHAGTIASEAARLARAVERPVKVRWTRAEEFAHGYVRPAAVIDIRSGASGDGLAAWEMRNINSGMFGLAGPYEVAHQRLDHQPARSPLRQGSYRALAATANHFARESHMDELAAALGLDPLAFRLAHLDDERLAAVLHAAADRIGWADARPAGVGRGIACGVEKEARVATAVEVRIDPERRVQLRRVVTAFDCGAIVDPDGLQNQIEGALVMGLGGALFEAVRYDDGEILNGSLTDYRVPRLADVPPLEIVLIDHPDVPSAGAGETPIVAIAPAIANAIFAASGVRLRSMPLVPDGVVPG
jgi:nicotinate dehydrogenase subunit B